MTHSFPEHVDISMHACISTSIQTSTCMRVYIKHTHVLCSSVQIYIYRHTHLDRIKRMPLQIKAGIELGGD